MRLMSYQLSLKQRDNPEFSGRSNVIITDPKCKGRRESEWCRVKKTLVAIVDFKGGRGP